MGKLGGGGADVIAPVISSVYLVSNVFKRIGKVRAFVCVYVFTFSLCFALKI